MLFLLTLFVKFVGAVLALVVVPTLETFKFYISNGFPFIACIDFKLSKSCRRYLQVY